MLGFGCALLLLSTALGSLAPTTRAPSVAPTTGVPTGPTGVPTRAPTVSRNFTLPRLPISKANAQYPDCRAEIIFVLDVSLSVAREDQVTLMRFAVQFMMAVEANIKDARFAVMAFGIVGGSTASKFYDTTEWGGPMISQTGPWGNNISSSTEKVLGLDYLRYNCTECRKINQSWSQLEMLYTIQYAGALTPTWDGLNLAKTEYDTRGDKTVPGRFIVLITDGIPNSGTPQCSYVEQPSCADSLNKTDAAIALAANGTLVLTVGVNLADDTQPLLIRWASEPKDTLAIPDVDYGKLQSLIPKLLAVLCPAGTGIDCLPADATMLNIVGQNFLNASALACRFYRDNESPDVAKNVKAILINNSTIQCPLPEEFFPGSYILEYTQDGRGYYEGARFKYGTVCRPDFLVIWWPFVALALLPLAFCRPKKTAPVTTQKVTRGVARPAPAATEEYEEYEEVEEIVAPPEPVNKWKVAPTAYIGFGRARMSVDWAGVAPESAPHEGVRKKVVKKVVSDHAPVPVAGPSGTPSPAPQQEYVEETVVSKPPIVEEPDWVNSFMDKIANAFCCCCKK